MATYSCILAWEIPWTEEPGGLQSMGHKRDMGHDLATKQQSVRLKLAVNPFGNKAGKRCRGRSREGERYLADTYIVEIYLLCAKKENKVPESPAATSE